MDDPKHDYQVGDAIRGKDTELRGRVLKILDAGYLMILETVFDMEMNIHISEIVKDNLNPNLIRSGAAPKEITKPTSRLQSVRIDLHLEKLPHSYKNMRHALEAQLLFLRDKIAIYLNQGLKEITIIHGKGSGTLHQKIKRLLKDYPQIKEIHELKVALDKPHGIQIKMK